MNPECIMERYLAEFVGTLFFLYVIIATSNPLAIGVALVIAIVTVGQVSGGLFNPAVTLMMAAAGRLPINDVAPYIAAQVLGGMAALEVYARVPVKLAF